MAQFKNLMEIFKLLNKTNCRKCNETTCLAFAAAVFKGEKQLAACPDLDPGIIAQYGVQEKRQSGYEADLEKALAYLKSEVSAVDFSTAAKRIGAVSANGKLTLKVMGKDFSVDNKGYLYSDIHVNPWVTIPILTYILQCKGSPVNGKWMPLRELPGGQERYRLFAQRCEKPLKKLADTHTELFEDLVDIFNGRPVENHYQSDIAIVLQPLPLVPMLVCYWKPEDGMASDLNLFFDASAPDNLGMDGIYALGTGIVNMFEKLALRHGVVQ
ncbi:MAG: DUF3786 domain-containing protein [Desulfobacteraceae bacterium]|nr:DUF3786 domain-containing protein [Desulfobacteraceae bacterium]